MIEVLRESMTGWQTFYSDGVTTHAFFDSDGMEMGGYYEDPNNPDNFHAYLRSGDRSGDRMEFSNAYDAIGWVENEGDIDFDNEEVYENVPGGRYWEPGWEDANDEDFVDYDADNYGDEELPFDGDSVGFSGFFCGDRKAPYHVRRCHRRFGCECAHGRRDR